VYSRRIAIVGVSCASAVKTIVAPTAAGGGDTGEHRLVT